MEYVVTTPEPGRVVMAWSTRRLPFEPTGGARAFRDELRRACRTLCAGPDEILHAVYTSPRRDVVDVENVLTYNLGTEAVSTAARRGLVLERSFAATGEPGYDHGYRYGLEADGRDGEHDEPLAEIELVAPESAFREPKAGRWWLHAARAGVEGHDDPRVPEQVALTITVAPPSARRGSLITLLKPLTDGLTSAMHRHQGPDDPVIARRRAVDEGLGPDEMRRLLHPDRAPLGTTRLVVGRGQGLQWLPADDRIVRLDARLADDGVPGTVRAALRSA